MQNYITIGEIIRHYRTEQHMSQEALANGICDRKYISKIETNKQIPTLDMVNQLSERLGVNLYENYSLMLEHVNIDTHKRIEELNKHFYPEGHVQLQALIEEYKDLPEFQHGVPFLTLAYAQSQYLAWRKNDYNAATEVLYQALTHENIGIDHWNLSHKLSNTALLLLNALAVNYCRLNNYAQGQRYLNFLMVYIHNFFHKNHFATNRNNQFELRFAANITYNHFVFFHNREIISIEKIDTMLSLLKALDNHCLLPELLLCKTYLLADDGNMDDARKLYNTAHCFGTYLYGEKYQKHIEETILAQHLPIFNTCQPS